MALTAVHWMGKGGDADAAMPLPLPETRVDGGLRLLERTAGHFQIVLKLSRPLHRMRSLLFLTISVAAAFVKEPIFFQNVMMDKIDARCSPGSPPEECGSTSPFTIGHLDCLGYHFIVLTLTQGRRMVQCYPAQSQRIHRIAGKDQMNAAITGSCYKYG